MTTRGGSIFAEVSRLGDESLFGARRAAEGLAGAMDVLWWRDDQGTGYGVPAIQVRAVVDAAEALAWQAQITAVAPFDRILGGTGIDPAGCERLVVLEFAGDQYGIFVRSALQVSAVSSAMAQPLPQFIAGLQRQAGMIAVLVDEQQMLFLLDVGLLFNVVKQSRGQDD